MKRRAVSAAICIAVFLVSFGITGLVETYVSKKSASAPLSELTQANSAEVPALLSERDEEKQKGYILKEYKGNVGVFSEEEPMVPVAVTEIRVSGLRGMDRELVEKGIAAETYKEVLQLMEDFNS